jgi:copper transport protein
MESGRHQRRSNWAILVGAGGSLLATLAEPPLQTLVSPPSGIAPSLDEALRGLPDAWWLRPAALVPLLMVMIGVVLGWRRWPRATGALLPLGLGLVALLGLSLTSHAAARESLRGPALLSNLLHQWSVALWAGGLVHLALNWTTSGETPPVRRFSRVALPLVAVGVLTGVANAGLVLPAVSTLWGSTYGVALLLKVALLVVPLGLATFNRVALRRIAGAVGASLRRSVRLELAVVVLVALGGSTLALLAPPEGKAGDVTAIELVSPLLSAAPNPDDEMLAHLRIDPAAQGDNALRFWLTSSDGAALPIGELERVRLDFTSLDHAVRPVVAAMEPEGNGSFRTDGLALSLTGWWRIDAGATVPDGSTMTATFYLILPDPNVHGFAEPPIPSASDEGQAVFERGLAALGALSSARWSERIGDGLGHLAQADYALREAAGDDVAAMSITAGQTAVVRIGERAWLRRETTGWLEQPGTEIIDFETLAETYAHAVAFRLGVVEEIDGEPAQIVTFYLPETERSAPAWFAWWIGVESGQLVRETMVARSHYMVHEYRALNEPLELEPPPLD